jgi:hypothetical protein
MDGQTVQSMGIANLRVGTIEVDGVAQVPASFAEVVAATNVLTAAESGKTSFLNLAGGFTTTLPAPAAGLKFKFVVSVAPTTAYIITVAGGVNVIEGMADVNSTLVLASNEGEINFAANTAIVGDWVEVESDGTSYFVTGQSGAAGGITFTAA